jgi:hypothetical protein
MRESKKFRAVSHVASVALLVITLAASMLAFGAPSSGAIGNLRSFALTGSIEVGPPPGLTLPAGSTFTATIDSVTGAFSDGRFVIPSFDRGPVSGPQAIITLSQIGDASGVIDPVTGAATITTTFGGTIEVPLLSSTCPLGEMTMTSSTSNPSGSAFSGSPLTGTTTASGFTVPAIVGSDPVGPLSFPAAAAIAECSTANAATINSTLGLPSTATSATFTAVETTPAPGPVPEPVVPSFTG